MARLQTMPASFGIGLYIYISNGLRTIERYESIVVNDF